MNGKVLLGYCLILAWLTFVIVGMPNTSNLPEFPHNENALNRTKRDFGAAAVVGVFYAVGLATMSISNSFKCSATAGCFKGYCWTWCGVSLTDGEWCYTTKTYSQSFEYVPCKYDSECNECWKCAGSCTL